jgi:hypothetical protein
MLLLVHDVVTRGNTNSDNNEGHVVDEVRKLPVLLEDDFCDLTFYCTVLYRTSKMQSARGSSRLAVVKVRSFT